MSFKKVIKTNVVKGSLIGFVILSSLLPGVITSCINSESMNSFIEENKLDMTVDELVKTVNGVMKYPDLVILSGVDGDDDIGYELTKDTIYEGYEYLTYKVNQSNGVIEVANSKKVKPKATPKPVSKTTPKPANVVVSNKSINIKDNQGKTVVVMTRAGFIRNLALIFNGKNPTSEDNNWELVMAQKGMWLPKNYTKAELDAPITREEICYISVKALKLKAVENYSYADVLNSPYKSEIMTAISNALLVNLPNNNNLNVKSIPDIKEVEGILERIKMSPDEREKFLKKAPNGRLVRTTNLPKYASHFEYIYADLSNDWYDFNRTMTFLSKAKKGHSYEFFEKKNIKDGDFIMYIEKDIRNIINGTENVPIMSVYTKDNLILPKDMHKDIDDGTFIREKAISLAGVLDRMYNRKYQEFIKNPFKKTFESPEWRVSIKEYLENVLKYLINVDYRTIDEDWLWNYSKISSKFPDVHYFMAKISFSVKDYIDYVKEKKIIVKCNKVQVEPDLCYGYLPKIGDINPLIITRAFVDFDIINFENLNDTDKFLIFRYNEIIDYPLENIVKGNYQLFLDKTLGWPYVWSPFIMGNYDYFGNPEYIGISDCDMGILKSYAKVKPFIKQ